MRTGRAILVGILAGSVSVLSVWGGADEVEAAELTAMSAGAAKPAVMDLAETFRRETGHVVQFTFATVGTLQQKVAAGEMADIFIMTDAAIDDLARKGIVAAGTRTDLGRVGIGVAVREGAAVPDISTPEALKQTLLSAKSLVYVDPAKGGTSGIHFAGVLERLGIAEAVKAKTTLLPGGYVVEPVAKGEIELGVHQISEILAVKGVRLVGPLPRALQKITIYSAGLAARTAAPDAARTFIAFLTSPAAKSKFIAVGLDYKE